MEPAAITAARSVGCRYLEVVTHQPDKQAASTARRTSTARTARRQPRFAAFLISGALLGLLLGFVLSAIGPADARYDASAALGLLGLIFAGLGALLGGVIAVLLEKRP